MRPLGWLLGLVLLTSCQSSACPPGAVRCGDRCVTLGTESDCRACGDRCDSDRVCRGGTCACPAGQLECAARCVDPASDAAHCGACGIACGEARCANGRCECESGTFCDGRCVDTRADASSCGACGVRCHFGQRCVEGTCECPAGQLSCEGACVSPLVDSSHCGGCGARCDADRVCVGGACECRTGTACPDGCRDLTSDPTSCGACGATCTGLAGSTCRASQCVPRLEWVRTENGGNRYTMMGRDTALARAPDGGVFAAWGQDSNFNTRIYVARYSPSGAELWRQLLPGGYRSAPTGMAARTGQVLLAVDDGTLWALDDATGASIFTLVLGESMDDVASAPDGTVIAVGAFRTSIMLNGRTFLSHGHRDIFLVRLDPSGVPTQAHTFGGIADDMDARVTVDDAGTIYLAGHTGAGLSLGGPVLGSTYAQFLGALAPDGAHLFSMRLPIEDVHEIDAVPGGVALLGVTERETTLGGVMLESRSLFVGTWDVDGTARWVVGLRAAPDYDHQGGIAYTDGVVYVTSGFWGEVVIGGTRLSDTDVRDVFLGALAAPTGAGLWVAGFGGLEQDDSHAIVTTPGAVTLSGRFGASVDFGGETRSPVSRYEDSFVVRYGI